MKLKSLGIAVLMALALTVFADTASATSLEITGVKQPGSIAISKSLKSGTSILFTDTFGSFANTCTNSIWKWITSVFSGTKVEGGISELTFTSCTEEAVTVDTKGSLTVENIAGTTNGTLRWIGGKWTSASPFGPLTCTTAASPGTDVGKLTGVASGNATEDISYAVPCGPITGRVTATYTVTVPDGFGATS